MRIDRRTVSTEAARLGPEITCGVLSILAARLCGRYPDRGSKAVEEA